MADVSAVDWQQMGIALGTVVATAVAAWGSTRRMWRKGFADLLRPVVQTEVNRAARGLADMGRAAMRAETSQLRGDQLRIEEDVDALQERVARVEGAVDTLSGLSGNRPRQ
jgi:hypothetical protein